MKVDKQMNITFDKQSLSYLKVLDVLRVEDKTFSVSLSMYFGVFWTEGRLKVPTTSANTSYFPIDLVSWNRAQFSEPKKCTLVHK